MASVETLHRATNRYILELAWLLCDCWEQDPEAQFAPTLVFPDDVVLTLVIWRRGGGQGRLRIRMSELRSTAPPARARDRRAWASIRDRWITGSWSRLPSRANLQASQARRMVSEIILEPIPRAPSALGRSVRAAGPEVAGWYRVRTANGADADKVKRILAAHPDVAASFMEPDARRFSRSDAGDTAPEAHDFPAPDGTHLGGPRPLQRYRHASPAGVGADVLDILQVPGGDGEGVTFIDIEEGWWQGRPLVARGSKKKGRASTRIIGSKGGHPDLPVALSTIPPNIQGSGAWHGSRVLGVVSSRPEARGSTGLLGIAPAAGVELVGAFPATPGEAIDGVYDEDVGGALAEVAERLEGRRGPAVVLLEVQSYNPDSIGNLDQVGPVVLRPEVRDQVKALVKSGVVVVIPTGNRAAAGLGRGIVSGNFDFDPVQEPTPGKSVTSIVKSSPIASGGLLVTSAVGDGLSSPWQRKLESVFGTEVKLFAQGEGVMTSDFRVNVVDGGMTRLPRATDQFADTSAAAAIVAGAATVVLSLGLAAGKEIRPAKVEEYFQMSSTLAVTQGLDPNPNDWTPHFRMPDLVLVADDLELLPGLRLSGSFAGQSSPSVDIVEGRGRREGLSLSTYDRGGLVETQALRGAGTISLNGSPTRMLIHYGDAPESDHPAFDPDSTSWGALVSRQLAL